MKVFNRHADMHKISWADYCHKQRFAVVTSYLSRNAEQELQTIIGEKQAEYFATLMTGNSKQLAEQISYKKRDLAEMEEQLAKYDEYAKQLKELY
jgi:ubiquinone biosynthesis protein UbiJ